MSDPFLLNQSACCLSASYWAARFCCLRPTAQQSHLIQNCAPTLCEKHYTREFWGNTCLVQYVLKSIFACNKN